MIDIIETLTFEVIVNTKSSKCDIGGEHDGALKVYVNEAPEKGKANLAVRDVLSRVFGVLISKVSITSGETNRRKRITIEGLGKKEFLNKIGVKDED